MSKPNSVCFRNSDSHGLRTGSTKAADTRLQVRGIRILRHAARTVQAFIPF